MAVTACGSGAADTIASTPATAPAEQATTTSTAATIMPSPSSTTAPSPAPPAVVVATIVAASLGPTDVVSFEVPTDGVAVSVLVRAEPAGTLVQLETLSLGGIDRVGTSDGDVERMPGRHSEHEIIVTDLGFVHEVQQGLLTLTYPFAPGPALPPGPATVSFLVDSDARLDVEILVLRAGERSHLPVTVFTPGEARLSDVSRDRIADIFGQAGITVGFREAVLPAGVPAALENVEDRSPGSPLDSLSRAVAAGSDGGANVVLVDSLPGGLSGFATGVPGAHDGSGMAVTVAFRSPVETARTIAHEIAHLLGLRHLEDRSARGVVVRNPIEDTAGDAYNLMQFGSNLTQGQIEIIRLSPLLEAGP